MIKFWTKSPGTGGRVLHEEDFVVDEIPLKKFFAKFSRKPEGVEPVKGPYSLALLKKKGMTTKDAISFVSRELGIPIESIGYAGLKDKLALTSQYLTIKGNVKEIRSGNLELSFVGFTDKFMQVGELEGNHFAITLSCTKPENAERVITELKTRGMPNFFGPQRFGIYGNNHVIGRLILLRDFKKAVDLISRQKHDIGSIREVNKRKLKFYIHAYQSFLFNSLLEKYMSGSKPFFEDLPIIGFGTKLNGAFGKEVRKLLKKEKIGLEDFYVRELGMKAVGSFRRAFVKIEKFSFEISGNALRLDFELPKGSYATVLIAEVSKSK